MNDADRWIYLDGPEPEHLRPFLDALRDLPPATPADRARAARRFFEELDATEAPKGEAPHENGAPAVAPVPPARAGTLRVQEPEPPGSLVAPLPPLPSPPPDIPQPAAARAAAGAATAQFEVPPALKEAVPFKPPSPDRPHAAKTLQGEVRRNPFAETLPVDNNFIETVAAALPFAGNTVGTGVIPFPRLKLHEYASCCAELIARRLPSGAVLLKYHVLSDPSHRALNLHWLAHFEQHPEAKAAFDAAFAAYTSYLRSLPPWAPGDPV